MTQHITKIKFANKTTIIHLNDTDDQNLPREVQIKSEEDKYRHPDFDAAMKDLTPWILGHFGYPESFNSRFVLNTVNLSRNESQGLCVKFSLVLSYENKINGVSSITMPLLHEDLNETGFNNMPIQIQDALGKLLNEAQSFMGGKFAQGDLFNQEEENENAEEEDEEETQTKKGKKKAA